MTRKMYDSVTVADLPTGGDLYLGYANGRYKNYEQVKARFPLVPIVSVATQATCDAQVLDVENHDATPAQAPAWCTRQRNRGQIPTVYCIISALPEVKAEFKKQRVSEPNWFIAHYDNKPVLPPGMVAKQYGGNLVGHYDLSVVADYWPGVDPLPVPHPSPIPSKEKSLIVFRDPATQRVYVSDGNVKRFVPDRKTLDALFAAAGLPSREPVVSAELTALFPTAP